MDETKRVTSDTIRLDKLRKQLPPEAEDRDIRIAEPKKKNKDFSDQWEPEYEEPLGSYTPPIQFKPTTPLQILRAKLVAGPEKRYYELSKKGLGSLQAGILMNFLIFLLAAGTGILYCLGLVDPNIQRMVLYGQLLFLLLAALVGCYRLLDGLWDLCHLRFTLNTLLVVTFGLSLADAIACLGRDEMGLSAVFCLEMLLAQAGSYGARATELSQMDTLRKASRLEALVRRPDFYEGRPGFLTTDADPDVFMQQYRKPGGPELALQLFGIASLLCSLGLGLFAQLEGGSWIHAMTAGLLAATPATIFIAIPRPQLLLQKRLAKLGSVVCGWQGVKASGGQAVYPLHQKDLFPNGSAKVHGVRYFGATGREVVLSYAASLAHENNSSLYGALEPMMLAKNGRLEPVEDIHCYDGGLTGLVCGEPVILGNEAFMDTMEIELPDQGRPPQAIYVAINGQLSGIFAVPYSRSKSSLAGLRTLCDYRRMRPVLVAEDFLLTEEFLTQYYPTFTKKLVLPPRARRQELSHVCPQDEDTVVAMSTKGGLAPKAFGLTGARMLRVSLLAGAIIHILAGSLGLIAVTLMVYADAVALLTVEKLLLYHLFWMIPGFLVTQWPKQI